MDWVLRNAQSSGKREAYEATFRWALSWVKKYHAADPDIQGTVSAMRYLASYVGEEPLIEVYDEILRKNPSDGVKANALFNKAFTLYRNRSSDEDEKAAAKARAKKLFRKVVADYAEESVADRAKGFVFEIDHLQIGMKAPEIVGKDADGKEIRLSQFFGQVVVIDFWGFW